VVEASERKGFVKGAEAMRITILADFSKLPPGGMMLMGEVAHYVAQVAAPRWQPPRIPASAGNLPSEHPASDLLETPVLGT
jgi:hypothetical protein